MVRSEKPSASPGFLHRLLSRADAREALAWFVLAALAFPSWRTFEVEEGAEGVAIEAFPYVVLIGIVLVAVITFVGALKPNRIGRARRQLR